MRKFLRFLVGFLLVLVVAHGYFIWMGEIHRRVTWMNAMSRYSNPEIRSRFEEYLEASGQYPGSELFEEILLSDRIRLPNGRELVFDEPSIFSDDRNCLAKEFRFRPRYDPQGEIIGGLIYQIGLDGDDDGGDEKDLIRVIDEIGKHIFVNPWYMIFPPDGDLIVDMLYHPDSVGFGEIKIPPPPPHER